MFDHNETLDEARARNIREALFEDIGRCDWTAQLVPAGRPLTPETSAADRTLFSQAGVGVGYTLSPTLRATSNWNTGLGRYNVSPGSQFTLGIAVRY